VIAQAFAALFARACAWFAVYTMAGHIPAMAKLRPILMTALVAAAGAIAPMLPQLIADYPAAAPFVSAIATALAYLARSPKAA
jgi:hypothetical protein